MSILGLDNEKLDEELLEVLVPVLVLGLEVVVPEDDGRVVWPKLRDAPELKSELEVLDTGEEDAELIVDTEDTKDTDVAGDSVSSLEIIYDNSVDEDTDPLSVGVAIVGP